MQWSFKCPKGKFFERKQIINFFLKSDTSKIMDLVPYVESMIWGCQKCNVECIKQFEQFIIENFGLDTYNSVMQFTKVTPEVIKSTFENDNLILL